VVQASVLARPLDGTDIVWVLNRADYGSVAPGIGADLALLPLGEVEATPARPYAFFDLAQGVRQGTRVVGSAPDDVEGYPLGALRPDRGELRKFGYEPLDRPRVARQRCVTSQAG
jgi:hypothetical protein